MGELSAQFGKICGQTWNSCVSWFEESVSGTGSRDELEWSAEKGESTFQKSNAADELVFLEKQQKVGEIDNLAKLSVADKPETGEPKSDQKDDTVGLTGLGNTGDEYLDKKYAEVDANLNKMMAQVNESTRETLDLKPGQKLPRPMEVYFTVSQGPGGHQTLAFQSIKAGPNFRHRINSAIPMYRTSADLSVAARQVTHSEGMVPEVNLSSITDDKHRITILLNPDGTYSLKRPTTEEAKTPVEERAVGS